MLDWRISAVVGAVGFLASALGIYQFFYAGSSNVIVQVGAGDASDPIVALTQRGYQFTKQDFERAILEGDAKSVDLFCDSAKPDWLQGNYIVRNKIDAEITSKLISCRAFDLIAACDNYSPRDSRFVIRDQDYTDTYSGLCGQEKLSVLREIVKADEEAKRQKELAELKPKCDEAAQRVVDHVKRLRKNGVSFEEGKYGFGQIMNRLNRHRSCFDNRSCGSYCSTDDCVVGQCKKLLGIDFEEIWIRETAG